MPSTATRRANQATAGDLAASISPIHALRHKSFSFSVKTTSDVCDGERNQVWRIFEDNMYELYSTSSFGWKPQQKMTEMFDPRSRFVIAHDVSDPANGRASTDVVAYTIFRFDREDRQDVIYCYELQVSKDYRRFGLGRLLTQTLSDIGARWGMTKVMLTAFKANHTAMGFYKSIGFTVDETSPDFSQDVAGDSYDYAILSRCIPVV